MTVADDPTDPVTFEDYSALQRSGYEGGDRAALLQMILTLRTAPKAAPRLGRNGISRTLTIGF